LAAETELPPVLVERLEFGKYCLGREGPIENGAEHGQLGWTRGFPDELIRLCAPEHLGLAESDSSGDRERVLTIARPYGTVVRPVILKSGVAVVAYRLGIRPEAGSGSRPYRAARYLVAVTGRACPLSLYRALGKFEGFTRTDKETLEAGVLPECPSAGRANEEDKLFLEGAVICAISGVPVATETSEEEFFRLADILWHQLPPELKPLMSAGWNVTRSLTERLCLSSAANQSGVAVPFDAASRQWKKRPGERYDVTPGRTYVGVTLNSSAVPAERIVENLDSAVRNARPPDGAGALPLQPDFEDPATRDIFRSFGDSLYDEALVSLLDRWLMNGGVDWKSRLPKAIERIFLREARQEKVLDLLRQEFTDPAVLRRADRLTFECQGRCPSAFCGQQWRKFPRRCLIAAVWRGELGDALEAWAQLAGRAEDRELSESVRSKLKELFPRSLTGLHTSRHLAIFELRPPPHDYLDLVAAHAREAALAWAKGEDPDAALALISLLAGLSGLPKECTLLARGLRAMFLVQDPRDSSAWLHLVTDQDRMELAPQLERLWRREETAQHPKPERFITLLLWAEILGSEAFRLPGLRVAAGFDATVDGVRELLRKGLHVSPSVRERLTGAVWTCIRDLRCEILENWEDWQFAVGQWPADRVWILFGYAARPHTWPEQPTRPVPLSESLPPALLPDLLRAWLSAASAPTQTSAITLLCQSCKELKDGSDLPEVVRAIRGVLTGDWAGGIEADWEKIAEAIDILRFPGLSLPGPERQTKLWSSARHAWQLRLVMELFPERQFEPSAGQWALLVRERAWLRQHLEAVSGSEKTRELLAPALLDFFDPDAPEQNLPEWKQAYEGTVLWAAFGRPPKKNESLREALGAYGATRQQRSECCRSLLRRYRGVDYRYVWRRVLESFVAPILDELLDAKLKDSFLAAFERGGYVANKLAGGEIHLELDRRPEAEYLRYDDRRSAIMVPDWFALRLQEMKESHSSAAIVHTLREMTGRR